ncbi:FRG domain-containing protein [Marivita hallyeonensis]|uniref:FRG domain-containing protein n=1 Tax=Marivita hallyeonensis TaxID=996342 RepID=A0A1M5VG02_9RHOB|nr:FRG domain-containing protein [Marivita hallyeonensis]SHH73853.1 FRG domain-containing protein [Marivita hallyeonensis]
MTKEFAKRFEGQWLGQFDGTNTGLALLDLDLEENHLMGTAYAFDNEGSIPSAAAQVNFAPRSNSVSLELKPVPIHPVYPNLMPLEEVDGDFPKEMVLELNADGKSLAGRWKTDIGTSGSLNLQKSRASEASEVLPDEGTLSWSEFQALVSTLELEPYRSIFRGQSSPWRLRTSFHRTRRKDLFRYWDQDVPRVRHASVGAINQLFDPQIPEHNGAFMHLLQHHGYPTPLLDWTYSPYIAAFFAYSSNPSQAGADEPVRIFMFDAKKWKSDFNQLTNMTFCRPHFSLIEPYAIGNPRALPQQSIGTVTNLDDIESYIRFREKERGTRYLRVFDLKASEKPKALKHLGLMGISQGSLFPGIEGVCREYRERHFG